MNRPTVERPVPDEELPGAQPPGGVPRCIISGRPPEHSVTDGCALLAMAMCGALLVLILLGALGVHWRL